MNDSDLLKAATLPLLNWYAENKREMPWRLNPDPYRVWISEIMLQQTRIEAVLPYYERFLRELPDVVSLAQVSDDKLMKLWEGLGYYSRARNLKKAAGQIFSRYGGKLPERAEELRTLAGIGDYTAGAISSIAYGQPEPAVDGNVLRVVTRLLACGDDIAKEKTKKSVADALRAVYPSGKDASALTQAWMELGETVCLPNGAPKCFACPLVGICRARLAGRAEDYPVKSPKKQRRIEEKTILLLSCGERFAIRKREERGLLAGTWEFPSVDGYPTEKELCDRLNAVGVEAQSLAHCGESAHIFTHVEWRMRWVSVVCLQKSEGFLWKTAEEIAHGYAVPSAFRYYKRCVAALAQSAKN